MRIHLKEPKQLLTRMTPRTRHTDIIEEDMVVKLLYGQQVAMRSGLCEKGYSDKEGWDDEE